MASDRGIALFAAIWLTLLISAIVIGFTRDTRVGVRIAANESLSSQARQAAEAGIEWIGLRLAAEARGLAVAPSGQTATSTTRRLDHAGTVVRDGRAYAWRFGDFDLTLRVQDEQGKFDLNAGDAALLPLVLRAASVRHPERLAAEILEARGTDGRSRGILWRLSETGIASVADLAALPSMTAGDYARLAPLVTVYGGQAAPDLATVPDAVFHLLPLGEDQRALAIARRSELPPPIAESRYLSVTAEARGIHGGQQTLGALIRIDPGSRQPYRLIRHSGSRPDGRLY